MMIGKVGFGAYDSEHTLRHAHWMIGNAFLCGMHYGGTTPDLVSENRFPDHYADYVVKIHRMGKKPLPITDCYRGWLVMLSVRNGEPPAIDDILTPVCTKDAK